MPWEETPSTQIFTLENHKQDDGTEEWKFIDRHGHQSLYFDLVPVSQHARSIPIRYHSRPIRVPYSFIVS